MSENETPPTLNLRTDHGIYQQMIGNPFGGRSALSVWAENNRLKLELDRAITQLEEWEKAIGLPLSRVVEMAHERHNSGAEYALYEGDE